MVISKGVKHPVINKELIIRKSAQQSHYSDLIFYWLIVHSFWWVLQTQINEWNNADAALYAFFNKTFWNKIANQDQTFYQEVKELRRKVRDLKEECIHSLPTNHDTGEMEIKLYTNLSPNIDRYLCEKMIMKEESYITYLKKKFSLKLGDHNEHLRYLFYSKVNKTRLEESKVV